MEKSTDNKLNAQTFNDFFIDAVSSLAIEENRAVLDQIDDISDPVEKAIKKFAHHPSIIDIKKNVAIASKFAFTEVNLDDMTKEINNLNAKKSGTFMNIPVKRLRKLLILLHSHSQIFGSMKSY